MEKNQKLYMLIKRNLDPKHVMQILTHSFLKKNMSIYKLIKPYLGKQIVQICMIKISHNLTIASERLNQLIKKENNTQYVIYIGISSNILNISKKNTRQKALLSLKH